jgi:2,3-bisphosphoglycerate-independent phosphoglycerate mutase
MTNNKTKKTKILCILDGFGLSTHKKNNSLAYSNLPNLAKIFTTYPMITLNADGSSVGQEDGLVGNSEVGHMNIGGLKKVNQLSFQITESSKNNYALNHIIAPDQNFDPVELLNKLKISEESQNLHIVTLFSRGKVHSDTRHLAAAIKCGIKSEIKNILLHIITDGRDTDKKNFLLDLNNFKNEYQDLFNFKGINVQIASISGRFYSMDRDNNKERVFLGLEAMFNTFYENEFDYKSQEIRKYIQETLNSNNQHHKIENYEDLLCLSEDEFISKYINMNYSREIFDEYIDPISLLPFGSELNIGENDFVWFINFRTDRFRQIVTYFLDINKQFKLNLNIIANNDYSIADIKPITKYNEIENKINSYFAIFNSKPVKNTLSEYISDHNFTQLHISETEKYNHVTYFLNGGQNKKSPLEDWVVIPSHKVQTHADIPEMKAKEITDYIIKNGLGKYDYIIVNYANPDMIGHTGDLNAAITSMEFLDAQLGRLLEIIEQNSDYEMLITADHGNIEKVGEYIDPNSGKHFTDTEHNDSPVPLIYVSKNWKNNLTGMKNRIIDFVKTNSVFLEDVEQDYLNHLTEKFYPLELEYYLSKSKNCFIIKEVQEPILCLFVVGIFLISL